MAVNVLMKSLVDDSRSQTAGQTDGHGLQIFLLRKELLKKLLRFFHIQ